MAKTNAAAKASKTSVTRKSAAATSRAKKKTAAPAPAAPRSAGEPGAARPSRAAKGSKLPKLPRAVTGAIAAAQDRKAEDIVLLDLRKAGGFTDFFVICTGTNPRQITAIADAVRDTLKRDYDERATLAEGVDRSEWILLDYFNFVVHVFSRECRAFYGLERLWGNADRYEIHDEPPARASAAAQS